MNATDQAAEKLTEAILLPLREVGTMLAKALDDTRAEVAELQQHVASLHRRVAELEERAA